MLTQRILAAGVRNMGRASMASFTSGPSTTVPADKEQGTRAGPQRTARSTIGPRQSASTALPADSLPARKASEARTGSGKPARSFVGPRQSMAASRPNAEAASIDKIAQSMLGTQKPARPSFGPHHSMAALLTSHPGSGPRDTEAWGMAATEGSALYAKGPRQSNSPGPASADAGAPITEGDPQHAEQEPL